MDRQSGGVTREFSALGHTFRCFLLLLGISAVTALLLFLIREVPNRIALWVCLAVCAGSAVYFGILAVWYQGRPFLTLTPSGLLVRRFGHGPAFYPWHHFDTAEVTSVYPTRGTRFSYLVLSGPNQSEKIDICHLSQREYPALETAALACIAACREADLYRNEAQ